MTTTDTARPAEAVIASRLARNLVAGEIEDVLLYGQDPNDAHPDWKLALDAVRDSDHPLMVAAKISSVAAHAILCLAHETGEDPRAVLHRLTKNDCAA